MSMLKKLRRMPKEVINGDVTVLHLSNSNIEKLAVHKPHQAPPHTGASFPPPDDEKDSKTFALRTLLKHAVKIRCQNVSDYYWSLPQNRWYLRDDFPNISPAWRLAWFDWHRPYRAESEEGPSVPSGDCGALLIAVDTLDFPLHPATAETPRWWQSWILFSEGAGMIIAGGVQFFVTDKGRVIPNAVNKDGVSSYITQALWPANGSERQRKQVTQLALTELSIPLLALTFANCSNTHVLAETQFKDRQRAPSKVRRCDDGDDFSCSIDWHVLEIGKTKRMLADVSSDVAIGIKQRLHIARGHFKDYEDGKGLFGKHHGTYWWDQQTRGARERGEVKKDYDIKA